MEISGVFLTPAPVVQKKKVDGEFTHLLSITRGKEKGISVHGARASILSVAI
jgi:hypothetical protein